MIAVIMRVAGILILVAASVPAVARSPRRRARTPQLVLAGLLAAVGLAVMAVGDTLT